MKRPYIHLDMKRFARNKRNSRTPSSPIYRPKGNRWNGKSGTEKLHSGSRSIVTEAIPHKLVPAKCTDRSHRNESKIFSPDEMRIDSKSFSFLSPVVLH